MSRMQLAISCLAALTEPNRATTYLRFPSTSPWSVEYSSFTLDYGGSKPNKTVFPIGLGNQTDWDTGAAHWGLLSAVFDAIAAVLGVSPNVSSTSGLFEVACRNREIVDKTLEVGFPGNATIYIPLGRLVTLESGKCVTFILSGSGGAGVSEIATNFGTPFLRSVYATFNLDDLTVSFDQVKYTDEEDIVPIAPSSAV